jgi:hypothetical protein
VDTLQVLNIISFIPGSICARSSIKKAATMKLREMKRKNSFKKLDSLKFLIFFIAKHPKKAIIRGRGEPSPL